MNHNGSRLIKVVRRQHSSQLSIERRHLNTTRARVSPEQKLVNPVDSEPARTLQAPLDDVFDIRSVQERSFDNVSRHIRPKQQIPFVVIIECDRIRKSFNYRRVLVVAQCDLSDVTAIRHYQLNSTAECLTCPQVGPQHVTGDATATVIIKLIKMIYFMNFCRKGLIKV